MKPRNVIIEAPHQNAKGKYTCDVIASYANGALYVQPTSEYDSAESAQMAARGVQAYLQQREDTDGQS
jgi:hypothetical protein